MRASSLLKEYFLNTVSDDFENLETLREQIFLWPEGYQKLYSDEALLYAIKEALEEGAAKAYTYNKEQNCYEPTTLYLGRLEDLWFLAD